MVKNVIQHQVKVVDGLNRVLPPQHVNAQLDTRHAIQIDDGPLKAKASQVIKVIGSHRHLPLNNMKSVGNVPPPLNKALHQGGTHRLLWKKTDNRLKTRLPDIAPSFWASMLNHFTTLLTLPLPT